MSSTITVKKRKPCPKGTRWVESAQKCMTLEEKKQNKTVRVMKSPLIPISYNISPKQINNPPEESKSDAKQEPDAEKQEPDEKKQEPDEKKQEDTGIMSTVMNFLQTPFSLGEAKEEEGKEEEEEGKKEEEEKLPDNFLLKENEKKCPKDYHRRPPHSRNCTRKKNNISEKPKKENLSAKRSNNPPEGSNVPEIQTGESEESAELHDDVSSKTILLSETTPLTTHSPLNKIEEIVREEEKKEPKEKPFELQEKEQWLKSIPLESDDLFYPLFMDPDFQNKIANKTEFDIFRYDGTIHDVKTHAKEECEAPFEISPHQNFVRHFMSLQTPYNSLLLYHGLGSGKSLSAIGVTEDMRKYLKQVGMQKKIVIVASPAVQANFRLQLFDSNKLIEIGKKGSGIWKLESGVGNELLAEINPTQASMTKEYILKKINAIIHEYYDFIGYDSLANYIEDTAGTLISTDAISRTGEGEEDAGLEGIGLEETRFDETKLRRVFDHRLIVIDEVHNIIGRESMNDSSKNKRISMMLMKLVKVCQNLRFLFLSATPMYNSYKEIIWLLNIMNLNDQRSTIRVRDVFNENGSFVPEEKDATGAILQESGRDLLKRKLLGYVSYVRGENPYTFPFRIYPSVFASIENQLLAKPYPKKQFNGTTITTPLSKIQVYANTLGEYQLKGYRFMIENAMKNTMIRNITIDFEGKESVGYVVLQPLISALNMIYPNPKMDVFLTEEGKEGEGERKEGEGEKGKTDFSFLADIYGKKGLNSIITYEKEETPHPLAHHFEYKPAILSKYGRIFAPATIGQYSAKIAKIGEIISNSTGIVLIYSKYIEGGLIPMALALEEMGFTRYGNANYTESLFRTPPTDPSGNRIGGNYGVNPLTMQPNTEPGGYTAKYVMITGQKYYSPNNAADLKLVTDISNKNGAHIRVVLISEAGSEGLDFKCIRQVHLLDPWYNMNRIEQVIGRAVRHKSHCALPMGERNVEIYMHGSYIDEEEETADMYMYRLAEKKAFLIGNVTRVLKETAVDCLLNIDQTNFTEETMNQTVALTLSTRTSSKQSNNPIEGSKQSNNPIEGSKQSNNPKLVDFKVGDKAFSYACDYMDNCVFSCSTASASERSNTPIEGSNLENSQKKNEDYAFLQSNHSKISKRIRQLFREKTSYTLDSLTQEIDISRGKAYPIESVYYTISIFLKNKEWLVDKKGHKGYMIQNGDLYIFQPIELEDKHASIFERKMPLDYKRTSVRIEMPTDPILSKPPPPIYIPSKSAKRLQELGLDNASNPNTTKVSIGEILSEDTRPIEILSQLERHIEFILSKTSFIKPGKQDRNWYVYAKMALRVCVEKHKIDRAILIRYVVFHYLDLLDLHDKLILLQKYGDTTISLETTKTSDKLEDMVRRYFRERIWIGPKKTYAILYYKGTKSLGENKIYSILNRSTDNSGESGKIWTEDTIRNENNTWVQSFDQRVSLLDKLNTNTEVSDVTIGFIGFLKEGVQGFKNMNIVNHRTRPNPGALCDQADKKKIVEKINDLLAFMGRTKHSGLDESYKENPILFSQPIERPVLCVIYEFLMRYFTENEKQLWYLTPEQAVATKLDTFVVKLQPVLGVKLFVLSSTK